MLRTLDRRVAFKDRKQYFPLAVDARPIDKLPAGIFALSSFLMEGFSICITLLKTNRNSQNSR